MKCSGGVLLVRREACEALHPRFGRRAADRVLLAEIEADKAKQNFEQQTEQADRRAGVVSRSEGQRLVAQ